MFFGSLNPVPGVLSALQRCLLEGPVIVHDTLDHSLTHELLNLLEKISQLLLGVLYGDLNASATEMGNETIQKRHSLWLEICLERHAVNVVSHRCLPFFL